MLLCQCVCFVPVMEGLCPAMRVRADVRALPQPVSEPGLRTRGLFILKCLVKWKEVLEEVPSLLLKSIRDHIRRHDMV